jgi:cytochrome P450
MDERLDILNETLRLEPVVGRLYRRTTAPVTLPTPEGDQELPVGTLIDLDIRAINADAATVGAEPLSLCPARELPRTVPATVMSFGDGHHRCPGGPLAIMETEIFLTQLLSHDLVTDGPPTSRWNAITQGYELKDFKIRLQF